MDQAVIVHLQLGKKHQHAGGMEGLWNLEDQISGAIEQEGIGEFDGHEVGQGEFVMYTYGPSADRLFGAIAPILKASRYALGGYAIKRYGEAQDSDATEVRVTW